MGSISQGEIARGWGGGGGGGVIEGGGWWGERSPREGEV